MMRILPYLVLMLMPASAAAQYPANSDFACPYSETRDVLFTSKTEPDTLYIDIIGEDCATADVVLMITDDEGDVLYASRRKPYLYRHHEDPTVNLAYAVETYLIDTKAFASGQDFHDEAFMRRKWYSNVNWEAVERVRDGDLPVFFHGPGLQRAVAFLDGRAVHLFDFGT